MLHVRHKFVERKFLEREEMPGQPHEFSEEKTRSLISQILSEETTDGDNQPQVSPRRVTFY